MKILIVDDNAQNRYLLEQLFGATGYACVTANNGRHALARLRAETFDAIISDILMPDMDGFQLCREVRADPALRALPFIFYTATYTDAKDETFALSLGADRFLIKPAEPEVLLATMAEVLAGAVRVAPTAPPAEEAEPEEAFLQHYNARLVQKLEKKMLDLERAHGQLLKANVALRDEVGRRQQAEAALGQSVALLRATVESTADGLLAVDSTGQITGCNQRFLALWRLPTEGEPPHTLEAILPTLSAQTRDPAAFEAPLRALLERPYAASQDIVELLDGRVFDRLSLPQRADTAEAGRVWSFRDVTERRQADEARAQLQSQLAESHKMEALGLLAGGVAHDFNNLLTVIVGQTELAGLQLEPNHPARANLAAIEAASGHSSELVRQIFTFSRRHEPVREVAALDRVVLEALKLVRVSQPPAVMIETIFGAALPPVKVDRTHFQQVLMNLVANASHAMGGRGKITVTLDTVALRAGELHSAPELSAGTFVRLTVRDEGCGMDAATMRRVFEPFFTTKPVGVGMGLGLAVVHGIMQAHEGGILVESAPGVGTAFHLYFPAFRAVESGSRSPVSRRGAGELILLVTDDATLRDFAARILQAAGYRVEAHDRVEPALAVFRDRAGEFALSIVDFHLPEMKGGRFVRALHALRPVLPVVVTTAPQLQTDWLAQIDVECTLLEKPCTAEALCEAVRRALGGRKS